MSLHVYFLPTFPYNEMRSDLFVLDENLQLLVLYYLFSLFASPARMRSSSP